MAKWTSQWLAQHRSLVTGWMLALLLVIVAVESFLLYQQGSVNREIEGQSARLLAAFSQADTAQVSSTAGVPIRLANVRFKWSDKIYVDTSDMALRAVPIRGATVDFDDLDSFLLTLQQSVVRIRPDVLEGMLNESVFNYPHSKLRDLKVTLTQHDNENVVQLTGSVFVALWIPFTMSTHLLVDPKTNTLVIDVDHLKALGFIPMGGMMKLKSLRLESILSLPPNKSLIVDGNRMMVKPFGLFPPPRVNGQLSSVTVDRDAIRLGFSGEPIPAPSSAAKNYVYLRGGSSQFGNFRMQNTDILILDQNQTDTFVFSLLHYADMLPKSTIEVHDTKSVRVTMPDL